MFASVVILLFFFCSFIHCNGQSYCYMEDTSPYQYFGTKTSYALSRASDMEIKQADVCKPVYMWALIRHGTRYTSKADSKKSNELQRQILSNHEVDKRGQLCSKDLKNFKQWTSQGNGKSTDDLAPQGKSDLAEFGERLAVKFKDLLGNTTEDIYFETSTKRRTKDSAAAFIGGLFGIDRGSKINISSHDDLLQFLELSEVYQSKVAKNNETFKEKELLLKTKQVQNLMTEVSDRLGFNETLPEKLIRHMYFMCAYENAWSPNSNPAFCAAFTEQDLQLLEYLYFDLPDYYEAGYGSSFNIKMHNPVIDDLLSKMTAASESPNEQPKAHFHFSHSAILTHTIAKLGLYYDDEPLRHTSYGGRKHKPKWSMHTISPFSGNLVAVLQRCDGVSWMEKYAVALYHNEHLIQIPDCPLTHLCPLSQFSKSVRSKNLNYGGEGISDSGGLSTIAKNSFSPLIFALLMLIGWHHHHHHHHHH